MQNRQYRLILSCFLLITITLLSLSGCGPGDYYSTDPTRIAGYSRQATQQELSSQADYLERMGQKAEATAQAAYDTAEGIRAAQQATQMAVQRQAVLATQTAYEYAQQAEIAAQATQEERAWMMTGWTATASSDLATSTAVVKQTQQAATAFVVQAEQERTRLALEQQRTFNDLMGALRFLIPVLLLLVIPTAMIAVAVYAVIVYVRSRRNTWGAVYPAANGDKPLLMGGQVYIDPDRAAGPIIDPSKPYDVPLDQQLQLVAGDQHVDGTRALPRTINQTILPTGGGGQAYQIVNPHQRPPTNLLPDPDVDRILDADWTET